MGLAVQSTGQILIIFAIIALSPPSGGDKPWGERPSGETLSIRGKKGLLEAPIERRIPRNSNGK